MKQVKDSKILRNITLPSSLTPVATSNPVEGKVVVLIAMCLSLFMTNFDGTAGDIALPQIQKSLNANISGVQWFLNAYHLPVASLLLTSGKFGDVFGRKRIFLIGITLFTVSSALCGIASNLEVLIAGRSLQGVGAAALLPLSLTILSTTFAEPEAKAKAIGIWSAVSALAMVAGPGVGGWLVDSVGWQSIFLVNVPLGVLTCIMAIRSIPKDQPAPRLPIDWPGLILSILSIAFLTYALTQSGPWLSFQRVMMLALTSLSVILFGIVEFNSRYPVIPPTLLTNQRFTLICITQTLIFFMSGGLFFVMSLFLQHVQGYSAVVTGLCFLPMNGAIVATSFASGWIASRWGWRFPILSGLAILTIAILSLTRIDTATEYSEILWTLILAGFGGGLTIPSLATAAMNSVLPHQEGIASSISSISIELGGVLGIAIQGALFSNHLTAVLQDTLREWNLSAVLQAQILENALHNLTNAPNNLPTSVSFSALQDAIRSAFVSGLQTVLFSAVVALIIGIVLILLAPIQRQRCQSSEAISPS